MSTPYAEIQNLAPTAVVELFVLDATPCGGGTYYFHAGTNQLGTGVVWQGQTYAPFPVQAEGFEWNSKGTLPRPKLRVSALDGVVGGLVRDLEDLVGAKVTLKRTFVKYLDAVNFSMGTLTATNEPFYPSGTTGQLSVGGVDVTASVVVTNIYHTDYQGTLPLYPTARTNLFLRSEDITNWSTASGSPISTATTLEDNNAAVVAYRQSQNATIPQDSVLYCMSFLVEKRNTVAGFTAALTGGTLVSWSVGLDTTTGDAAPLTSASNGAFWMVEDLGSSGWKVSILLQNNNTATKTGSLRAYPSWGQHADPATNAYYWPSDVTATGIVGVTKCQTEVAADQSSVKALLFGDSLTAASSITPSWWQLIGLAPSCFSNYAVGSTTSSQAVTAYDAHKTETCTDVFIETGVNDLAAGTSATAIESNLAYMWADAKARGHRVWAFTIAPWKGSASWTAGKQTETDTLNAWIRAQSSSYDHLIDMAALLEDSGNPGAYLPLYQRADLIHPSPRGMQVVARAVMAAHPWPKPYTSYIGPTTTAAITRTDYSYTSAGVVTLAVTATGSYTWTGTGDGGGNPTADPTACWPDEPWVVERKTLENDQIIEFELVTPMDVQNARIPGRRITANVCGWTYKGAECGYAGALPTCGKTLAECKAHFPSADLPFGAFPGTARVR